MLTKNSSANKLLCLFVALLLTFSFLTGCSDTPSEDTAADSITFIDDLGREVTVRKQPQKVAALLGSFADIWCSAGGTLCACADDAWTDFGLESDTAVNLGGAHSPSLELLLSAEPDFVLASASTAANVEMKEVLESLSVPVAYFDVDCFQDYLHMLDICTDITGRKDLYKTNGTDIELRIEKIKSDLADKNIPEEHRTVLLLRASSGFVKAKGSSGTVLGELLKDIGCINIADSDTSLLENLSAESVIRRNPYRIFVVTMGDDTQAAIDNLSKMLKENPAWGKLEAVEENRLHIMEKQLFNLKPNAHWALAYEKVAEILQ